MYSATEMLDDTESDPVAIPRSSPSHPSAPKGKFKTYLNNPLPRPSHRSRSDKTIASAPDSAVVDLSNQDTVPSMIRDSIRNLSNTTEASAADSAVDVKTPSGSGSNISLPSNVVVEKTMKALGRDVADVLPQAGMHEAMAAAESTIHCAGLSSEDFHLSTVGSLPPMPNKVIRRVNTSTNLRLDTSAVITSDPPPTQQEERSPYANTGDSELDYRINIIDRRSSTVRERKQFVLQPVGTLEISGVLENPPEDSIPGALLAHEHPYKPHRAAPSPPNGAGERKIRNPFKCFCNWTRRLNGRREAQAARKREVKEKKVARYQEAKTENRAAKRAAEEAKSAEQQRRRDSIARAMDAKAKIKRDIEVHRERQRVLEMKTKENAARQKQEMAGREKAAKFALKERKRQDAVDMREERLKKKSGRKELEKKWERENLGRSRRRQAWGYVNNAMGKYDGEHSASREEEEMDRLLREAVLEKQYEAAQLKSEKEERERARQRTGDVDPSRQDLTWWEMNGLNTPPTGSATAAGNAESTEDSDDDSHCSQDTGDIEDAVRRVGEVDDAMANVL